jgi:hypothetical protein
MAVQLYRGQYERSLGPGMARSSSSTGRFLPRRFPAPGVIRRLQAPQLEPQAFIAPAPGPADAAVRDAMAREFGRWWS